PREPKTVPLPTAPDFRITYRASPKTCLARLQTPPPRRQLRLEDASRSRENCETQTGGVFQTASELGGRRGRRVRNVGTGSRRTPPGSPPRFQDLGCGLRQ